jgi:hypothetical protein
LYSHEHCVRIPVFHIITNKCYYLFDNIHVSGCKVAARCGFNRFFKAVFLSLKCGKNTPNPLLWIMGMALTTLSPKKMSLKLILLWNLCVRGKRVCDSPPWVSLTTFPTSSVWRA